MSNRPGSSRSDGLPPGTGVVRPGSGVRRGVGTASGRRIGTGVANTGAGTEAAQGVAITAAVSVSDRPLTGQGLGGMRVITQSSGRVVMDTAYFVGILRKRLADISNETSKLRQETEQLTKENSQYSQYEKKFEQLVKTKDLLEGQLADYNLAMDKIRTSTDADEVQQLAQHLSEKNRQSSQELDRVFIVRKQREQEVQQLEEQLEAHYRSIQARINELEPGKLRVYNDLMSRQREFQEKVTLSEHKINELTARIRHYESDDKGSNIRKEYVQLDKQIQTKRKELDTLQEELSILQLQDGKEAHNKFVQRVNDLKQLTKTMEDRITQQKEAIDKAKRQLATYANISNDNNSDAASTEEEKQNDAAKYELLKKRDSDMSEFIEKFPENRATMINDLENTRNMIVGLLEHIGKGLEDQNNLPSQENLNDLKDASTFKKKNLDTAQRTLDTLQAECTKREKELEVLKSSEPKLIKELNSLKDSINKLNAEMTEYQDVDGLRKRYENTQTYLHDLKVTYLKRRDAMRLQVQTLQADNEGLKRSINNNEVIKELEETEKRLKQYERGIFELKEFIEQKALETNYETLKSNCVKLMDSLNAIAIRKSNT